MKGTRIFVLGLTAAVLICAGCTEQTAVHEPVTVRSDPHLIQSLNIASGSNLTLVEKEYTSAELRRLGISCVKVLAGSDDIVFTRRGDTLKLRYYQQSADDYELTREALHGGTRTYLCLTGNKLVNGSAAARTIEVSLPESLAFYRLYGGTEGGNITFAGCVSSLYYANSVSGDIVLRDCKADETLTVETHSGRVDITGLTTGAAFDGYILSESGAVQFSPVDPVDRYHLIFGTRPTNTITVSGKRYNGGSFELNQTAAKTVCLESGYFYDDDAETGRTEQGTAVFNINGTP